jgi:hypothetical protein
MTKDLDILTAIGKVRTLEDAARLNARIATAHLDPEEQTPTMTDGCDVFRLQEAFTFTINDHSAKEARRHGIKAREGQAFTIPAGTLIWRMFSIQPDGDGEPYLQVEDFGGTRPSGFDPKWYWLIGTDQWIAFGGKLTRLTADEITDGMRHRLQSKSGWAPMQWSKPEGLDYA